MKIILRMKDGTEQVWRWRESFALVCLRYMTEVQQSIEEGRVKQISIIQDDGQVWMKKGLKAVIEPYYKQYSTENKNQYYLENDN